MSNWLGESLRSRSNDIGEAITNTPTRQKMNELRTAYRGALDGIRGDASMSELGKQQLISRAWTNTRAELARLAQLDFDSQVQRYNNLERQVFGATAASGADAVSFRDATDRADRLENPEAALKALGTAELSGDTILTKAIVLRAWQADWTAVVDQYAVNHPTVTDKLTELTALRRNLDGTASRLGGHISASLPKPTEIANLDHKQITDYANTGPSPNLAAIQLARMHGQATPQQEADARAKEDQR